MTYQIDVEKCILCGMCRNNCPVGLFEPGEKTMQFIEQSPELCIHCGHCIAACPKDAVTIKDMGDKIYPELVGQQIGLDELQRLLLSRRSIRHFTDKSVDQQDIDKIIAAVGTAPIGMSKISGNICIINGREKIEPMVKPIVEFYRKFMGNMKSSIGKVMMRMMMGKYLYLAMKEFMPLIKRMVEDYDVTKKDTMTWGAPCLMLFHAPKTAISGPFDTVIDCTYAMLAAHAMGLGTTIIGMVPPYIEQNPDEKKRLGIPSGNKVELSLIVGHPKTHFVKGIERKVPVQTV